MKTQVGCTISTCACEGGHPLAFLITPTSGEIPYEGRGLFLRRAPHFSCLNGRITFDSIEDLAPDAFRTFEGSVGIDYCTITLDNGVVVTGTLDTPLETPVSIKGTAVWTVDYLREWIWFSQNSSKNGLIRRAN